MNCKNRLESLCLKPSKELSGLPLSKILPYRSISSTIYLVKLQSHSLTVHFVANKISSLSSVDTFFILRPLYKSISYLALTVNGVWTSVTLPSDCRVHFLGSLIDLRNLSILSSLLSLAAIILSLSIVCKRSVSLSRVYFNAFLLCSAVNVLLFFICSTSVILQFYIKAPLPQAPHTESGNPPWSLGSFYVRSLFCVSPPLSFLSIPICLTFPTISRAFILSAY